MASLYVIRGRDTGKNFALPKSPTDPDVIVGRDAACRIKFKDSEVSRRHATIACNQAGQHVLTDLASSNGTFVNGNRHSKIRLQSGDHLQIGSTTMIYTGGIQAESLVANHGVDLVQQAIVDDISQIKSSVSSDLNSDISVSIDTLGLGNVRGVSGSPSLNHELSRAITSLPPRPAEPESQANSDATTNRNYWEIMYLTSRAISRTPDINQLLKQIIDLVFEWIHCDRGCIMLTDPETGGLTPACRKDRQDTAATGEKISDRMSVSKTILDYVISRSEGVLTSNALADKRFESAESIVSTGIREAICVPLQGRYSTVGAIYLDTHARRQPALGLPHESQTQFVEEHLKLMVAIGHQAAVAIEDSLHYNGMLQAERMAVMGQTMSRVSHHIKNVLQGIRMGSYIVDDGIAKDSISVVQRGWKTVTRNTDRIADLVLDMLNYSKERDLKLSVGNIRELTSEAVDAMQLYADEKSVNLTLEMPAESDANVWMDAAAIDRALANILSNGIEAAGESKSAGNVEVRLALDANGNRVSIHVRDNGLGIADAEQDRIFAMFESSKGSAGTGLGLPISRKILQEHAGDIELHSQSGGPTEFTLWWPIQSDLADINENPDPAVSSPSAIPIDRAENRETSFE
jgi:signal transduction histidine kinase